MQDQTIQFSLKKLRILGWMLSNLFFLCIKSLGHYFCFSIYCNWMLWLWIQFPVSAPMWCPCSIKDLDLFISQHQPYQVRSRRESEEKEKEKEKEKLVLWTGLSHNTIPHRRLRLWLPQTFHFPYLFFFFSFTSSRSLGFLSSVSHLYSCFISAPLFCLENMWLFPKMLFYFLIFLCFSTPPSP